ncbi:uncharacterized protein YndB with AHSA1/START domain [Chitinophaga skermanii]|uniref:Uncharacterized protein YndB with AHSA1/START domain n=1 Tax=Chitinophaga skermanii TaxID=331697 RepID=A0A327QYD7_9BACT|nr:SRPBCC domain-containing protein [Chitinophaga skermanii]RAJ08443.1 uncharacterized protein YndB with AHSA1/START domain [Chitinophaga skermanii]
MAYPASNLHHVMPHLSIQRALPVPCHLVFAAWTNAAQIAQWWGPAGFSVTHCEFDLVPGGDILILMQSDDGMLFPATGRVHHIHPPQNLVFSLAAFDDEQGDPQLVNLISLSLQPGGHTTNMTINIDVIKAAPIVRKVSMEMSMGWEQSIEKLTAWLKRL